MFKVAQIVVRHKLVVAAVAVAAYAVFGGKGEVKKVNPWDTDSAQAAASEANTSLTDKAIGVAAGAAKHYAGVDVDKVLPGKLRQDTVDNWQAAGDAAKRANGN